MANIKVSEMTEATTFEDGDYTMIVQSNQNKKISHENILGDIKTDISTINTDIGDVNELTTIVKTDLVSAINSLMPTVIYTNNEGASGDITLTDNISNYSYYEIIFSREGQVYSSLHLSTEFVTNVVLSVMMFLNDITRLYFSSITISGTSLTRNYSRYVNIIATGTNDTVNQGSSATIYIHKIIGYK